ncbi:hypothetical protein BDQ12DRAFT_710548 [Crucibulum laeve]|uniref:NAD(P)-binding protein n=1 Tax=Crucibulum laeve TaxID=68775 RepID=A0A5C3M7S0_9AGAR|nr:hypothetical protein BDQ12DRAFT_710548 [Crucibulum laeve]
MGNTTSASLDFNPTTDLVDLNGKVVVVTGGNSGIGLATVRHLARAHAKVYLAARSESRAHAAIAALEKEFEDEGLIRGDDYGEILWHELDLTDPRDAKRSAEAFLKREKQLDILINNAAILKAPFEISQDGISTIVIINYMSPFVFTYTLLPLLKATALEPQSDVRVVNISSMMHDFTPTPIHFNSLDNLNSEYKWRWQGRYAYTKLLVILWTLALQSRLGGSNITCISLDPGGVDTFSHTFPFPTIARWILRLMLPDPVVGSFNSVFATAGKKVAEEKEKYMGVYLESKPIGKIGELNARFGGYEKAEELWKLSKSFLEGIS